MLYYPQLATGSLSQYPVTRGNRRRTVTNTLADGGDIREEDAGCAQVVWDLTYTHLTPGELAGIQRLFEAVEGRLGTFVFLDPTDNLLSWSQDFARSTWTSDPLLQMSGGIPDIFGGSAGWRVINAAQADQQFGQTIAGPAWFQYCFSAYLRSDAPCTVRVSGSSKSGQVARSFEVGPQWSRAIAPLRMSNQDDGIHFALASGPGASFEIFGPQVEAQLGAGPYKQTTDSSGVYAKSRFDSDALTCVATGPQQYSCSVRVASYRAG